MPYRQLEAAAATQLLQAGFTRVDYISIAHPHTLQPVDDTLPLPRHIQVLGAAYLGPVRLIDNIAVS
jgi:pantoate--beta-alanine ligase